MNKKAASGFLIIFLLILAGLGIFLFKDYIFPTSCNAWLNDINEAPLGANLESTCQSGYVCVPKTCNRDAGECSGSFLSQGHDINNPAVGVCHKGLSFPF